VGGIGVGLWFLFYYTTPKKVVVEYPHPQKLKDLVYRDTADVCYGYSAEEVDCDSNEANLKHFPIQN